MEKFRENFYTRFFYKKVRIPLINKNFLKATGGGVPHLKFFLFVRTHFVALVMGEQELFTESENFRRLPRYGLSKMGPTRAFSQFYIGKCPISVFQNYLLSLSTFPVLDLETPFFDFEKVSGCQKILWERIFEKVIFGPFGAILGRKNGVFQISAHKTAPSGPKNDFFKNPLP